MKTNGYKLRLSIETLLIIAGCEGMIMFALPFVFSDLSTSLASVTDTTLLTLTVGPLLYWRFSWFYRFQEARHHTEIEQRTAELRLINATMKSEAGEHQRTQSFLNSIIDHLPIPVFIKEAKELRFVLWNKAGEKLTGISNAEMIGKNDHDFFPPADAERNIAKDRAAFEKKDVLEIPEEVIQTRDHGARIVHVWKVPIFDATGQPAYLLGIAEDITDRKQAEAVLHQSEDRFRLLVEESPDMVGIYQDGKLVFINPTGARLLGSKTAAELLGRTVEHFIHPDDLTDAKGRLRRRMAGETGMYPTEVRYLRLDGTPLLVEVSATPITFEGKPAVQFVARDITDRKRAEQRHALQHAVTRILMESTTVTAAMPKILCAITESQGFSLSAFWRVNRAAGTIQCQDVWHTEENEQLTVFATASLEYAFRPGEDLPGWVWSEGELAGIGSILNHENFQRTIPARAAGLIGAVGFPLLLGGKVIGIIECFSPRPYQPDPLLHETLASVNNQIALFSERKMAQKQLADSERHMRLILEAVPECIKLVAADGTLLDMNPAGLAMVEADRIEQAVGQCVYDLASPSYRAMFQELNAAVFRGEPQTAEFELIGMKGTRRWMETSAVPLRDEEGRITTQLAVTRDITKRRQSEELLRLQEAALRAAANTIVITDRKGLIVWVNPAFTKATGYSAEEALGENPRILQQKNPPHKYPVGFFQDLWKTIANGDVWQGEFHNSHKDGTPLIEEAIITPVRGESGQITHFVAVKQNITTRRQAEELLRLRGAVLHATANVVVITDRKGLIVWTNPAFTKMFGYTAEEALGENPRILQQKNPPHKYPARFYQDLWKTIANGEVWQGEFHNCRKDGTPLIEEAIITPVRGESGQITHFVAVKQDITERKRAESELAKAQKELLEISRQAGMAEVATGVLHNVGNVLNSVNVAATCVADTLRKSKMANLAKVVVLLREHEHDLGAFITSDPKGKQVPGYLAQLSEHLASEQAGVQQELAGLQKHIDHIKDIVIRQQSFAKVSGITETLAVADLIEDALKMQDSSLIRHEIAVLRDFGEVPPITVEKHKVLHILVNLMNNAKQACLAANRDDKQMTLRVMNGDNSVKIAIGDNGVGILPEHLTRIFAHGFTTKKEGHGFGLHSGALAAKELGGALNVHSAGAGHGSVFTLELPLKPLEIPHA